MSNVCLCDLQVWFMGEHSHISAELDNVRVIFPFSIKLTLVKNNQEAISPTQTLTSDEL